MNTTVKKRNRLGIAEERHAADAEGEVKMPLSKADLVAGEELPDQGDDDQADHLRHEEQAAKDAVLKRVVRWYERAREAEALTR